jgi:hypothetical protein
VVPSNRVEVRYIQCVLRVILATVEDARVVIEAGSWLECLVECQSKTVVHETVERLPRNSMGTYLPVIQNA